jgi:sialate O-acetylesterase
MPSAGLISLTFDDALGAHLDVAMPILDAAGLRGTFYAHVAAAAFLPRADDWRRAAAAGHEIGNHTIFHPATEEKSWVRDGNAIESYGLDRMRMEIDTANRVLASIDGRTRRTFAYPCSNPVVGRHGWPVRALHGLGMRRTRWPGLVERAGLDLGSTRRSYAPLLPHLVAGARGGGLSIESEVPPLASMPRYQIPSAAVDGHPFEAMKAFAERALNHGRWGVLQFHGVGGGHHMDCRLDEFIRLVEWLASRHHERVVTVLEGAERLDA